MRTHQRATCSTAAPALLTALGLAGSLLGLAGCGGSESTSPNINQPTNRDFVVDGVNVVSGAVWKLNRPIEVRFNAAVDFSTVNSNTIQITDTTGIPALGEYALVSPTTVRFQPLCPTNSTNSNGGLQQGRVYFLVVVGGAGGVTVRDTAGRPVETGITVSFQTPASNDPVELFVDQVAGPPTVLVRGLGGVPLNSTSSSYVELGGDPNNREYLRLNPVTQQGELFPFGTQLVPLNLYSRAEDRFAVVLQFNQPINASDPINVSSERIRFEFRNAATNQWIALPSRVELLDNCSATGSSVRVTPEGIVPQGADLRINVRDGFEDLTGDSVQADLTGFVRLTSETVNTPGTADPTEGADEVFEDFTFGGGGLDSREDLLADSTKPRADWGGGVVQPSFAFQGTGGPGGNFDYVVPNGQVVIIDTAADQIRNQLGQVQTVINGIVDVNNFTVELGGTLLFVGPNTATILAKGNVLINGVVSANGGDNPGVKTLNTTNQPEPGAPGNAGGGNGGTGSFLTSQSTPRGGPGFGAFQRAAFGGGGGETSYAAGNLDRRRGAGGGGGRLGVDTRYFFQAGSAFVRCQSLIGFDAEPGFPGGSGGTGAVSQTQRAQGGAIGPFPFFDQFDDNNFLGVMRTAPVLGGGGQVLEPSRIIIGELTRVWAGAGGGAGGDAVNANQFPVTPFNIGGDEKGSGGGGGAGGIQILAIGTITVGPTGRLTADGGYGGAGENTIFFDRVGGGGGGGSGGHIVLSSANSIVVQAEAPEGTGFNQAAAFYTDAPAQLRHPMRPVSALGGQGGAGKDDRCGANAQGVRDWKVDAIPPEAFEGFEYPPLANTPNNTSFTTCNTGSPNDPIGTTPGAGGDGGPGIIQFHASNLDTQILFPNRAGFYGTGKDVTFSVAPPPLGWTRPDEVPDQMIPFFGDESEALSTWIALGQARRNPDGSTNLINYTFGGTNQTSPTPSERGVVERTGTSVTTLPSVLPFSSIVPGQTTVPFVTGGNVVTLDAAGLDDLYKKNAALVRSFRLRLRDATSPTETFDFTVLDATYDAALNRLVVTVDPQGSGLVDTILLLNPNAEVGLLPNFFQLVAAGIVNNYPDNTSVRITFDATNIDPVTGGPDLDQRYSVTQNAGELTPNITALNAANWDFIRFRVEFDLDVNGTTGIDLSAPRPAVDYLRIPFRF